ncbi:response regulator transcription factor [Agromyces silvae]|uniref:response regulator transcription factor n=1 Tax=Agromyces silvae TaxID=3388266 RepID=UPI00280B4E67|nr:response regulator transcription factor [Agromyces protaetiae]
MSPVRVAIVEDQPLYRQMLQSLLQTVTGFELRGVAGSVAEAREAVDPTGLDVALLDLHLPDGNGLDLGRSLQQSNPSLGVMLLSSDDHLHVLLDLPEAQQQRWSYLSKTSSLSAQALVAAVRATAQGRAVLDRALVERRNARANSRLAALSSRQLQILALLAEGLTNASIAQRLELAHRSVENHVNAVYAALGLTGSTEHNPRVRAVRMFLAESR